MLLGRKGVELMQQGTPVTRLRRETWNKVHNSVYLVKSWSKILVIRLGTRVLKDEPILNKFVGMKQD